MNKIVKRYLDLFLEINELLWQEWDPIGVRHNEDTEDEYSSYVPGIMALLLNGASAKKISAHLDKIKAQRMLLENTGKTESLRIAERIRDLAAKNLLLRKRITLPRSGGNQTRS